MFYYSFYIVHRLMRLSVNEKAKLKIMLKIILWYFAFKGAVSEFGKSPSLIELLRNGYFYCSVVHWWTQIYCLLSNL